MSTLLETALAYTTAGWPIFPVEPNGKQPLGRLVPHGLKDASLEEEVVRRWWRAEPHANIAIPTGIVFDVADIDSAEAMVRFTELCGEHGTDPSDFPRAKTGRGGRHVFLAPTGVGNKVDVIPGMDWRGKGGYVVVPNSVHPSGTPYEWILKPAGSPPECPDWLLALITRPVVLQAVQSSQAPPEAYIETALDNEIHRLRSAPIGTRNDQLNRSSFALGQMVGAGWLTRSRADAELRAAAQAIDHGHEPGLTATLKSGLEAGMREPRQPPAEGWGSAGGVIRLATVTVAEPKAANEPWLTPLATWLTQPEPNLDWVIDGMLIRGGVGVVGAKPKVGKTTLLHQLALSVARGVQFLERKTQSGPVIYLALEEDRGRVIARFRALKATPKDEIHLLVGQAGPDGLQKLAAAIGELGAVLAIVDPIQRLTRLENINDYSEVSNATDPLIGLARQTGCAIIFSHHLGKMDRESGDQLLGSTALFGAVDTSVVIRKQEDGARTLETIQRYGRSLEPVVLGHDADTGAAWVQGPAEEYEGDQAQLAILKALEDQTDPISHQTLLNSLTLRWDKALRAINRLVETHQIQKIGGGRRGDGYRYRALIRADEFHGNFVSLPNTKSEISDSLPISGKESGKETGKETGFLISQDSLPPYRGRQGIRAGGCPACGAPAFSRGPAGDPQRKCHVCGELYTPTSGEEEAR